ncbi:MarR family transcriptional regulator [bacterium]|nr:MarR family transcriptional regulator [bacterium]
MSDKERADQRSGAQTQAQVCAAEGYEVERLDPQSAVTLPSSRYDLRVLKALRQVIRATDLYSRRLLTLHNITSPQLICLLAISEEEPVTVSKLAKKNFISPSTLIGILDRLDYKGLIGRSRDTRDRRIVNVILTESGKDLIRNAPSPLQDKLTQALNRLPETEKAAIAESIELVVKMMDVDNVGAAPILEVGTLGSTRVQNNQGDVK